jgi:hypothetical protein
MSIDNKNKWQIHYINLKREGNVNLAKVRTVCKLRAKYLLHKFIRKHFAEPQHKSQAII